MDTITPPQAPPRKKRSISAREMGRRSAKARMISLTPEQRSEISRQAVLVRWNRVRAEKEALERAQQAAEEATRLAAEVEQIRRQRRPRVPAA